MKIRAAESSDEWRSKVPSNGRRKFRWTAPVSFDEWRPKVLMNGGQKFQQMAAESSDERPPKVPSNGDRKFQWMAAESSYMSIRLRWWKWSGTDYYSIRRRGFPLDVVIWHWWLKWSLIRDEIFNMMISLYQSIINRMRKYKDTQLLIRSWAKWINCSSL